jgi:hypothetical protein
MNRLLLGFCAAAAFWTAACGGGSIVPPPPPVGKYNLASLKGQYAFVSNGEAITSSSTATQLARTGSFIADGLGGITGGLEDVNAAGLYTPALQISGGSYTVNADGRGTLTLNVVSNGAASPIKFGIVLTSVNDGLLIDETSNNSQASTGSGNFVKQNVTSFTSPVPAINGAYVFDFSGLDGSGFSESFVAEFTAAVGATNVTTTAAFGDLNDDGVFSKFTFSGTFGNDPTQPTALASFGRGVAVLNGTDYVFYIVDGTRVRLLSTSGGTMLSGDAVSQSNNVPTSVSSLNSGFVFIVSGTNFTSGVTRVGRFTANGAAVSKVLVDTNNGGSFQLVNNADITSSSISLDALHPGRGTVTFTSSKFSVPFTFVFYLSSPTSGVIQDISQSSTGAPTDVADGSIEAQSGGGPFTSANITGTYALNWSGLSFQQGGQFIDEEDLLAQTTVTSLALSGTSDIFPFTAGQPQTGLAVGGSINFNNGDGTGGDGNRTNMSVIYNRSSGSTVNCVVYIATPQLAFFANKDNQGTTRIIAGVLKTQQ